LLDLVGEGAVSIVEQWQGEDVGIEHCRETHRDPHSDGQLGDRLGSGLKPIDQVDFEVVSEGGVAAPYPPPTPPYLFLAAVPCHVVEVDVDEVD